MPILDREEHVEQAYFFRAMRERVLDGLPAQEVLARIGEELLSSTKLPLAISFLYSEAKLAGSLAPAMARISHYFTAFQTHVIGQAEKDVSRFPMDQALLVLEKEAEFKSRSEAPTGLFVYQFEAIARNRLGYSEGIGSMAEDPAYSEDWSEAILDLRARLGDVDFAEWLYARSDLYVADHRRRDPDFVPRRLPLFGEKEGKIARANRGRDPVYLFMALQRQLGYPEVPRLKRTDEAQTRLALLEQKTTALESRVKTLEMATGAVAPGAPAPMPDALDLEQVRVRPEQTAGVPAGWGRSEG